MSQYKEKNLRRADDELHAIYKKGSLPDKRGATRFDFDVPCMIRLEDSLIISGQLKDISQTGAYIKIRHYDNESVVNQRALLHWEGRLEGKDIASTLACCIVRANRDGIGVSFRISEKNQVGAMIRLIEKSDRVVIVPKPIENTDETEINEGFILGNRRRDEVMEALNEEFLFSYRPTKL
jgi:hypothetical protein